MGMGFAPTWLRQVSPPPASQNHFNHWRQPAPRRNTHRLLSCSSIADRQLPQHLGHGMDLP